MLGIILAGIAPGLALLSYFYLKDKDELEPISLVVRMFLLGAILLFPTAFLEYILKTENIARSELMSALFSSGMLEELFKWFVLFVLIYLKVDLKKPYDGIVYGTSVSLGFATAENLLYLIENGWGYALNRALLPVSSHALFGVIMGYYVGIAKFYPGLKSLWLMMSILFPSLLHGIYNYILLTQESWLTKMIPFMFILWSIGMKKVQMAENLGEIFSLRKVQLKKA